MSDGIKTGDVLIGDRGVENARPDDLLVVTHDGDAPGSTGHDFREGEVIRVRAVGCHFPTGGGNADLEAEHLDRRDHWWISSGEVRVATPSDIMALGVA